jgi:hypothetical protein
MLSPLPNEDKEKDRELQIDLARLQVQAQFYTGAVFGAIATMISVLVLFETLYFTLPSEYAAVKNLFASTVIIVAVVGLPTIWFYLKKAKDVDQRVGELKVLYQTTQRSTYKTPAKYLGRWLKKTENKALVVTIIGLCITAGFTALNTYHDWNPPAPRAKFTVFLNTPIILNAPENVTEIDVTGRIVNEGSLAGQILRWDLFIYVNMSYKPLFYTVETLTTTFLKPEEECNFTLGRTMIGANDTRLPENAIRNCTAWFEYRDASGLLPTAEGQVNFIP